MPTRQVLPQRNAVSPLDINKLIALERNWDQIPYKKNGNVTLRSMQALKDSSSSTLQEAGACFDKAPSFAILDTADKRNQGPADDMASKGDVDALKKEWQQELKRLDAIVESAQGLKEAAANMGARKEVLNPAYPIPAPSTADIPSAWGVQTLLSSANAVDRWTGTTYATQGLLSQEVGKNIDQVDGFVAGYAHEVSTIPFTDRSVTTELRTLWYGETATRNHEGAAFENGRLGGKLHNLAMSEPRDWAQGCNSDPQRSSRAVGSGGGACGSGQGASVGGGGGRGQRAGVAGRWPGRGSGSGCGTQLHIHPTDALQGRRFRGIKGLLQRQQLKALQWTQPMKARRPLGLGTCKEGVNSNSMATLLKELKVYFAPPVNLASKFPFR